MKKLLAIITLLSVITACATGCSSESADQNTLDSNKTDSTVSVNAEKEDTSKKPKNDGSTQTHKLSDTASVVIKTKDGTELFRYDGGTMEDAVEALYAATDDVEISSAKHGDSYSARICDPAMEDNYIEVRIAYGTDNKRKHIISLSTRDYYHSSDSKDYKYKTYQNLYIEVDGVWNSGANVSEIVDNGAMIVEDGGYYDLQLLSESYEEGKKDGRYLTVEGSMINDKLDTYLTNTKVTYVLWDEE